MLTNSIAISLEVIFYSYSLQISFLEYSIFNTLFSIKSTYSFKKIVEMLSHTNNFIFFQNKPVSLSFIKAFFISEETLIINIHH